MEDSAANLSLPPRLDDDDLSLPGVDDDASSHAPVLWDDALSLASAAVPLDDLSQPAVPTDAAISLPPTPRSTPPLSRPPSRPATQNSRSAQPGFAPGDLLANRFRILRFVARGGMGEVYEAEDLELADTLALKTVLPAIARDPNALALLKAEVQLSRKVTHPNVCRIFNLDCHRTSADDPAPVWFITMELLKGHTLAQEIKQSGKLTEAQALPLAQQMADGLEAVRRANIVHGDFKSSNVLLVPAADGTQRAVVTDFGLARTLEATKDASAARVGTPAYMAPEQVTGGALTPRTDVYAFGVVLYEMVTGQWPFNADTPEKIAAKRLTETPTAPVRFAPKLDPVWNRTILRCLEREPARRFESAAAAIDQITGRSRTRALLLRAAVVLVLVLSSATALARWKELGPFRPRPQIAVLGWHNRSGDPAGDWVGTELSERLTGILQASTSDAVVPQLDIDRARIELSVPAGRDLEQEDLSQFRTALGANSFVTGSYDVHGAHVTVDGVLEDAGGNALARFHQEGSPDNLNQVTEAISATLKPHLDGREITAQQLDSAASIYPKTPDGRRLYFGALEQLRSFDAAAAKAQLTQVLAAEPDCIGAHAALAEAWLRLKFDDPARAEAQTAARLALTQRLPPELTQAIQARAAAIAQNWADAAGRYKALHDFFPDQLNYSLAYATALTKDGQPANALTFLDALSAAATQKVQDPRIQVERAEAFAAESKFTDQLKAAQQSASDAAQRREKLLQANAELEVCWAQRNMGQSAPALEACEAALSVFRTFDDTVNAAVALNGEANIRIEQSDYKGAEQTYKQVLAITTKANAEADTAGALLNLAKAEIYLSDNTSAAAHLTQAIDLAHRIEDHGDEARARISLGLTLEDQRKAPEARQQFQQALEIAQSAGDRDAAAFALSNLGQLATDAHSFDEADHDLREALALRKDMHEPHGIAKLELRLADLAFQRGHSAESHTLAEQARADADHAGDAGTAADALISMATADLASGNTAAVLIETQTAIAAYRTQKDTDSEAEAHLLRARACLRQTDTGTAAAEIALAHALPGLTEATKADEAATQSLFDHAAPHR